MKNPFMNDTRIKELVNNKTPYATVFPIEINEYEITGFDNRLKAWNHACKLANKGLWVYVVDLYDERVIAYLTGFCNKQ